MPEKVLTNDLDNCLINFDRKVLVTNLLDEYGGLLEEIANSVNEFLSTEEAKGKKFLKTFLLRGLQSDSEDEVITLVPEEKLEQRQKQLRDAHSMLYSAETDGGSKSPPTEFVPLKHISIKLDSLKVKDASTPTTNGSSSSSVDIKEEKPPAKKTSGALGTMFKKQETTAAAKKSPENNTQKNSEPEKKGVAMFKKQETTAAAKKSPQKISPKSSQTEKKEGTLGAMFKKQESAVGNKKSQNSEPEKKSNTLGAMFKKQESAATKKSPDGNKSKKGANREKTKPSVIKPPTPQKMDDFFKKGQEKKVKDEPAANVSTNLFEESASSSSDDEEALDALKREVLTDDEEDKPSTSNKRRRIVDSDDEDTGPEVKVDRKEVEEEPVEIEDEKPIEATRFMDDDGFVVTVKAKNKRPAAAIKSSPTPVKIKKESPKSPAKKEAASKTPAAKKKQGNIMSFFTKK